MRMTINHRFDYPEISRILRPIVEKLEKIRMSAETILAKVSANNDILKSLVVASDGLNEGQTSIEEHIEELKKQIADGQSAPDLTALEAAVEEQGTVIDGLKAAVVKGTVIDPSVNP